MEVAIKMIPKLPATLLRHVKAARRIGKANREAERSLRAKAEELREERARTAKETAALGPPGTGKSTILKRMISYTLRKGGRVLVAFPTGQLASRLRPEFGKDVVIDTCHGAFLFRAIQNTLKRQPIELCLVCFPHGAHHAGELTKSHHAHPVLLHALIVRHAP